MSIKTSIFGIMPDGTPVLGFDLKNENGVEVRIIEYGATVTSILTPDIKGNVADVVLGFSSLDKYLACSFYFGSTIGRYSNRIADSKFKVDGVTYQLSTNDGSNHLHGGKVGFDKVLWKGESKSDNSVEFTYQSADGEMGYPGNLDVQVVFTLSGNNELIIDYHAITDKTTHVNLTNHSYFNLAGDHNTLILDHKLKINAENYMPVNDVQIPFGQTIPVTGTPFDFTSAIEIGSRLANVQGGYDHNFILNISDNEIPLVATLLDPLTKRLLEVYTKEPGLQLYSGNFLDGTFSDDSGRPIKQFGALCLETQHFPNSPNEPGFPSTLLRPGEKYETTTIYKFLVSE